MKRLCLCLSLLFFSIAGAEAAEKRIALLIGNKDYVLDKLDLKNPHNDIARVAAALEKVGFEVSTVKDASLGKLQIALRRYTRRLRNAGPGAIGFLYYSGHGALNEETHTNYLIPVDVVNIDSQELWDSSVRLRRVLDELKSQAENAQHFVVFDACHNSLQLASKTSKSLLQSKGFKAEREVRGMLISYATAAGRTASDIGESVGPYASALAAEIVKPGIEAVTMFRNVQIRVYREIQQEPWYTHGALGEVYFAGKAGTENAQITKPAITGKPPPSKEAEAWEAIKDLDSPAVFEAFIKRFPNSFYADFAQARLKELPFTAIQKPGEMPPRSPEQILSVALGYYRGNGDRNDLTKAAENFAKAAEAGSPQAMYWLGRVNELGEGVAKNLDQAVYWYERAARKKVALAQNALGDVYRNGTGVPRDLSQALKYYKQAAEQGFPDAMTSIGVIYASGDGGTPKDYAKAVDWYRRAAKKGSATAMNNLGVMYAKGYGVDRDDSQAVFWYKTAAAKDYVPALLNIAWRYDSGLGVPIDPKVSSQFFVSAVRNGGDEARQTLLRHADKLSNETRMEIQYRLREAGHDIGAIDGRFGSRTIQALEALVFGK